MKNLKKYFNFSNKLNINCLNITKSRDLNKLDQFESNLNVILASNNCLYSYSCFDGNLNELCNISQRIGLKSEDICVKGLIYDDITDSIVVCLQNGDILSFQLDNGVVSDHKILANIPEGIESVEWSPDRENVLVTNNNLVYLLSSTYYEILNEIDPSSITEHNTQVNVGWGKKETQFHGSEGKAAAKKTQVTVDRSLIEDDHKIYMSWRGDSQIFCISYWSLERDNRFIKVFDKVGDLLAVNEDIPGLTGPISWRPYGDLLAFSERTPDHCVIGFLEKNGLKHGDFIVPSELKVLKVHWNSSSSILGLVCERVDNKTQSLLLYTTANYHWYLKQKIIFPSPLVSLLWDEGRGNRVYGLCKDGFTFVSEWITTIDSNREWTSASDSGYVAVIDNDTVLLTSFKEAIIPPPMSRWSLKCPASVNSVVFPAWTNGEFESCDDHMVCTILHDGTFLFWKREGGSFNKTLSLKENTGDIVFSSLNHWIWFEPNSFATLNSIGLEFNLSLYEKQDSSLILRNIKKLDFCPISINYYNHMFYIQSTSGIIYKSNTVELILSEHLSLVEPCYRVECIESGIFSLSEKQRLYRNDKQIASQITSFLIHGSFLLTTTSLHTLVIFKIFNDSCKELSTRKLENGSKLVVATETTVIFQLPRGNLEAVQPRALTIETAGKLLESKHFREAVSLLCRQRIDLNLAVDHNAQHFLDSVEEFVCQIDTKWLTLLITELKPKSVTTELYSEFYEKDHPVLPISSKVKQVCEALYSCMVKDQETYILPILGALVKMNLMSQALELAISEDSLQHLLFLVDVDTLYNEALLAYNLEAALRIAGKSQKDPKEYLPYLNSLRSMEPNYMKYTIDKTLNRPESALNHLSQCSGQERFNECIQLIKNHSLYSSALKLFQHDSDKYRMIAEYYGDYLVSLKKYGEAGIMYKRSCCPKKAIDPYLKLGDWRQCIILSNQSGYSDKEKESLIQTLKGVLKGMQKYHEAGIFCLEVLNDVAMSVEMLVLGKHWQHAISLAKSKDQLSLIENIIKKNICDHCESLSEEIKTNCETFEKHCNRLQVVREAKLNNLSAPSLAEPWDGQSDASSIISSVRTGQSSVSRSSKNTRKTLRKMWSLKEGNPREEQALVSTLAQIIETVEKMSNEIQLTCLSLLDLYLDDLASDLQSKYDGLLQLVTKSRDIIWPKDPEIDETTVMDERLKIPPLSYVIPQWQLHALKL